VIASPAATAAPYRPGTRVTSDRIRRRDHEEPAVRPERRSHREGESAQDANEIRAQHQCSRGGGRRWDLQDSWSQTLSRRPVRPHGDLGDDADQPPRWLTMIPPDRRVLSAIGIRRHRTSRSPKSAGAVGTRCRRRAVTSSALLDKTGTITIGNRLAFRVHRCRGCPNRAYAEGKTFIIADEKPEGTLDRRARQGSTDPRRTTCRI